MVSLNRDLSTVPAQRWSDIAVSKVGGMTVLNPIANGIQRRILYLNSYGMAKMWRTVLEGEPSHHLWAVPELVRYGYEVAMPEEPDKGKRTYNYRRQDFDHMGFARRWLRKGDIVYSAHTILFWLPLLASLGLLRCKLVSLLYGRGENLRFSNAYSGLIGLTPAAAERSAELTPRSKIAHLSWGVDLPVYPVSDYAPEWFLSCGKTRRDFTVVAEAAKLIKTPVRIINSELPASIRWPENVQPISRGTSESWESVQYRELIDTHYRGCIAALITLQDDPGERYGAGFTQMIEAMALGRPVIVTRTGALATELDVEKAGCGLHVPPNDPKALAQAMQWMSDNPDRANAMGVSGRRLCERHYNIDRFGAALHGFFEKL